ncbi:MAG: glutathione peroxidase [Actinomycetota bacterium]|nr:glutathione peroxidase [Actinomycetota bacterium]
MTPQYAGLRALHHDDNGVRVLGFPCNQFGQQEPGSAEEIRCFIADNYDIDFPVFAKVDVNGDNAAELYQWLKSEQPGEGESSDVTWNFEKFLVNAAGDVVARFSPGVAPEAIAEQLGELLG